MLVSEGIRREDEIFHQVTFRCCGIELAAVASRKDPSDTSLPSAHVLDEGIKILMRTA